MKKSNQNIKHKNPLLLLWEVMTRKNKVQFFFLLLLGFVASIAVLIPTQMISIIVSKLSGEAVSFFGIKISSDIGYVAIIIGAGIITYCMRVLSTTYSLEMEKLIKRVVCNMRSETYSWLVVPRKNMDLKMTDGDALYRMNEAPEYIINVVDSLLSEILPNVFSAIVAFIYICFLDILSVPFILGSLLLVLTCVIIRTRIEKGISVKTEATKSAVSNTISNSIANLPLINLYKSMAYEQKIFDKKIEAYYDQQKKQINLRHIYWLIVELIEVLCTFGIIFLCAKRIMDKTMIVGNIIVIANYVSSIFTPIQSVGWFSTRWVQCSVKINRVYELKPLKQDTLPLTTDVSEKIDSLEIKNVNVQNGDIFRIENVNMKFEKGKLAVIYGESGCGKSTIMKVLCGLCERMDGDIIINGEKKISTAYLITDKMSVTMQSPFIFNRDVKLNVLYPEGVVHEGTKDIVELLGMQKLYNRKFNEAKQQNLENMLSGGEKKRVCIARGLLKPADIYIFDEPTNDLDAKNANNVIKSINKLKDNAIVIVVSHDERVMKKADVLIKMDNKVMLKSNEWDEEAMKELGESSNNM